VVRRQGARVVERRDSVLSNPAPHDLLDPDAAREVGLEEVGEPRVDLGEQVALPRGEPLRGLELGVRVPGDPRGPVRSEVPAAQLSRVVAVAVVSRAVVTPISFARRISIRGAI
jgi:hypothetical protein